MKSKPCKPHKKAGQPVTPSKVYTISSPCTESPEQPVPPTPQPPVPGQTQPTPTRRPLSYIDYHIVGVSLLLSHVSNNELADDTAGLSGVDAIVAALEQVREDWVLLGQGLGAEIDRIIEGIRRTPAEYQDNLYHRAMSAIGIVATGLMAQGSVLLAHEHDDRRNGA